MSAEFKVIKIDPTGSGMDYNHHLGEIIKDVKRCCKNCECLFGTLGFITMMGPFIPGELEPLNEEAKQIMLEIYNEL